MPRYLRPRLSSVPIFFTVALAQRGGRVLVDRVKVLREAVRVTRAERPFGIKGEERPENGPVDRFQR